MVSLAAVTSAAEPLLVLACKTSGFFGSTAPVESSGSTLSVESSRPTPSVVQHFPYQHNHRLVVRHHGLDQEHPPQGPPLDSTCGYHRHVSVVRQLQTGSHVIQQRGHCSVCMV